MPCLYANNVVGTLSIAVGTIDTVLQLTPGHGISFPTISLDQWFYVTLINPATGALEICRVTERTGDTLVVSRGVDGTLPLAWSSGTIIEMRLTAQMLRELQDVDFDEDAYLQRAGGNVFGPVRWLETDTALEGWTQDVIGGGALLIDHPDPNQLLYLYPRGTDGNGRVIAFRLQHSMPVKVEPAATLDLFSGNTGVASFLMAYSGAGAGAWRLTTGVGNTSWRQGNFFHVMWYGVGQPTVTAGPGITLRIPAGLQAKPRARYSVMTFTAVTPTEWVASGDLAEV